LRHARCIGNVRNEVVFPSFVAGPVGVNHAALADMSVVLLVEDELLVRELASEDLGDAGFDVTAASDGDEALGYLREGRRFDLLFTDIRMPGTTDGWQLAREAKALLPDIRVIYATGLGDAANGLAEGERYVRKPYSISDLRDALAQLGFQEGTAA
jgi:CheY-like chemotaxis protein